MEIDTLWQKKSKSVKKYNSPYHPRLKEIKNIISPNALSDLPIVIENKDGFFVYLPKTYCMHLKEPNVSTLCNIF